MSITELNDPKLQSIPTTGGAVQETINAFKAAQAQITKDISLTTPLASGFVAYDLMEPSKKLFPVVTPLRNKIPRTRGIGTARRYKAITGINTANLSGAYAEGDTAAFGSLTLARAPKITSTAKDASVTYKKFGLSDSVTFEAQIQGRSFEDMRATAAMNLLRAVMVAEERLILHGRSATTGAPGTLTLTANNPGSGQTGITGSGSGGTNVYVRATAVTYWGEAASAVASVNIANGATKVVNVAIPDVEGALYFKVYANKADAGGADPGDATRWLAGTGWDGGATGAKVTNGQSRTLSFDIDIIGTANAVPTSDTTFSAKQFDGLMKNVNSIDGSYYKRVNAALSLNQINAMFKSMWDSSRADPDELWVAPEESKSITDLVLGAANTPYRVMVDSENAGSVTGYYRVDRLVNATTGKVVKVSTHPDMRQGTMLALSYSLPFPHGEVNSTIEQVMVQDYLEMDFPIIQESYDMEVMAIGAQVLYAPTYQGKLAGILPPA